MENIKELRNELGAALRVKDYDVAAAEKVETLVAKIREAEDALDFHKKDLFITLQNMVHKKMNYFVKEVVDSLEPLLGQKVFNKDGSRSRNIKGLLEGFDNFENFEKKGVTFGVFTKCCRRPSAILVEVSATATTDHTSTTYEKFRFVADIENETHLKNVYDKVGDLPYFTTKRESKKIDRYLKAKVDLMKLKEGLNKEFAKRFTPYFECDKV